MNTAATPDLAREPSASLTDLLDDVARAGLDGRLGEVVARRARTVTRQLADAGSLPSHLVVAPNDPPVVVARLLAAAHRWVARAAVATAGRPAMARCA